MPLQATTRCAQQQPLSLHFPYQAGMAVAAVSDELHTLCAKEEPLSDCMYIQEALLTAGERTPGPSDYRADSRPTLPGKPAYTIAGRQSHASFKNSTPGPGAYAVRGNSKTVGSHPNAPGYSMPASGRPTLESHRLPGPGGKPDPLSSACILQTGLTMLPACNIHSYIVACFQLQCVCMYAAYCTEVRESGPQCSMKFRHEAGRLTGSLVAPPGPGQYSVTTCDRPRSAAFTFGCSRPQSGSQTARCAHVICSLAFRHPEDTGKRWSLVCLRTSNIYKLYCISWQCSVF